MVIHTQTYYQLSTVLYGSGRSTLVRSNSAGDPNVNSPPLYKSYRMLRMDLLKQWILWRLHNFRWRTLPIREGPLRAIVWMIIGVLQGNSPKGTSPPIRNDATGYVMRKTLGSSVPI